MYKRCNTIVDGLENFQCFNKFVFWLFSCMYFLIGIAEHHYNVSTTYDEIGKAIILRGFACAVGVTRNGVYNKHVFASYVTLLIDALLFEMFQPTARLTLPLEDESFCLSSTTYWMLVVFYHLLTNYKIATFLISYETIKYTLLTFIQFNCEELQKQRTTPVYPYSVALSHETVFERFSMDTKMDIFNIIIIIIQLLCEFSLSYYFWVHFKYELRWYFERRSKSCPSEQSEKQTNESKSDTQTTYKKVKRKHIKTYTLISTRKIHRLFLRSKQWKVRSFLSKNVINRLVRCLSVGDANSERFQEAGLSNLTENEIYVYKMDARPRGICVIINNRDFTDERLSRRDGTDEDKNKVEDFFRRRHFEVRIFENQTNSDMLEELKQISLRDHRSYDCFVCFILSHGQHGSVYGSNGKLVSVNEIQSFFCDRQCRSLADKPKLFFVQARQGSRPAQGVAMEIDHGYCCDVRAEYPVHESADFLTVFATTPGNLAYRQTTGSRFISTLIEVLDNNPRVSLLDIITMVTKKMDEVTDQKQIPTLKSTLRKQIILN